MATSINWPWPSKYWLRDGYGFTRANQHASLVTKRGTAMLRTSTTGETEFPGSITLSGYEVDDLKAWVQYDLAGGGLWFNVPVKTGHYIETLEVRFVDISEPIALQGADYFRVTATFVTRRGTEMDAATWADVKAVGGSAEFASINNLLDQIVNEDYPEAVEGS